MNEYLYICDKKPGACNGWAKGWEQCENEMCFHTTKSAHAKNQCCIMAYAGGSKYFEYETKCKYAATCLAGFDEFCFVDSCIYPENRK